MKVTVDLLMEGNSLISVGYLAEVTRALRAVFVALGKIRKAVTSVEIFFARYEGRGAKPGPVFLFRFRDFGFGASWEIDYRSIGSGSPNPTPPEIEETILKNLPRFIESHLKRCQNRLVEALKTVEELLTKTPSGEQDIQQEKFFHDACLDDGRPCRWDDSGTLSCNPAPGECRGCPSRPW